MKRSRQVILADLLELLLQLAGDWEYGGEITENTRLIADIGFESLDVVVLGTVVQEHFKQILPFSEFFVELGQRDLQDVTVGEWVDFIATHLDNNPQQQPKAMVTA